MPQQTQLYIVASRHPRVGKTLLARLLIEFLRISARPLVGYDLDPREPALAACFPSLAWPIDIAGTRGQMALFDSILCDHWRTTVIDLGHGLFDQFFKVDGDRLRRRSAAKTDPADCIVHHRFGPVHRANLCRIARALEADRFRPRAQ